MSINSPHSSLHFPLLPSPNRAPRLRKSFAGARFCRRRFPPIPMQWNPSALSLEIPPFLRPLARRLTCLPGANMQENELSVITRHHRHLASSPAVAPFRIWKQSRKETTHKSPPRPPASRRDIAVVQESLQRRHCPPSARLAGEDGRNPNLIR
jgi:hypothetical protein